MTFLVYLPLLLPGLLALGSVRLAATGRPERVARWLAAVAAMAAAASTASLVLLALTLLDDLPTMEVREHRSNFTLPEPVPGPVALAAAAALVWFACRSVRQHRGRVAAARHLHACGTPHEGILVAAWSRPAAVAVPALAGRAGFVLVTSGLLRLLDPAERAAVLAHERSHLSRRHHHIVAVTAAAAALNPLLRPVTDRVALLVERGADEDAAAEAGDRVLVARAIGTVALATGPRGTGGLGMAASDTVRRVEALLDPPGGTGGGATATAVTVAVSLVAGGAALVDFVGVAATWLSA
ncbi:M48 family metalloprotease [Virgisporangium aurantiacum]|uniref:Peptidase M48 n=1 Tax=Virgisporangium aurantiacum TaxID=175570 RepID=A0A8J4DXQ5_9ACTN|nr:M48 family metalloprotease [Virgisporangium aurantiacum]GIJ54159.1 peptidase M48 [Virgisporangium aurantiacum]